MNFFKRAIYQYLFILPFRLYRRLFIDLHIWGRENIPKGPKIYVTNHISCTDATWLLPEFTEPIHIVIGPIYHKPLYAKLLDAMEQINCMPAHRSTVVEKAVAYLKRGESIYIAPEGDIQEPFQLGRFYAGAARIYRGSRAPIVPISLAAPYHSMCEYPRLGAVIEGRYYRMVAVLRGLYCIKIGEPFFPKIPVGMTDQEMDETITAQIKDRIQTQLDQIRSHDYWSDPTGAVFRKGWRKARAGRQP